MPLRLDHVGVYVAELERSLAFYCETLGLERPPIEDHPERGIRLARVPIGDVELELIEGPVEKTMVRHLSHPGPGLYHLGVRVASTDVELERLKRAGLPALDQAPREGDGLRIAFVDGRAAGGVLIELVERKRG